MAGEDLWFNGMFSSPVSGGGEDNNGGCFGDPNLPFSGFSLPVSGLQSSASGFSTSFSREPNNFGSFFDPSNSSSSSSSSSSVSGVANQEVGFKKTKLAYSSYQSTGHRPIFQVPKQIYFLFLSGFLYLILFPHACRFSVFSANRCSFFQDFILKFPRN